MAPPEPLRDLETKLAEETYSKINFPEATEACSAEKLQHLVRSAVHLAHREGFEITVNDVFPLVHEATRFGSLDTMLDEFLWLFEEQSGTPCTKHCVNGAHPPFVMDTRGATLGDVLYYLLVAKRQHMRSSTFFEYVVKGRLTRVANPLYEFLRHHPTTTQLLVDEVFIHNFETYSRADPAEYEFRRRALTKTSKVDHDGTVAPYTPVKDNIKFVIPVGLIGGVHPFNQVNLIGVLDNLVVAFARAVPKNTSTRKWRSKLKKPEVRSCIEALEKLTEVEFSLTPKQICLANYVVLQKSVADWLRDGLQLSIPASNLVWLHPRPLPLTAATFGDYEILERRLAPRYPSLEKWVELYEKLAPCRNENVFEEFSAIATNPAKFRFFSLTNIAHALKSLFLQPTDFLYIPVSDKSFSLLVMMYMLTKQRGQTPAIIDVNNCNHNQECLTRLFGGKNIIVLDDVAASGQSLDSACRQVLRSNAASCAVAPILLTDAARDTIARGNAKYARENGVARDIIVLEKQAVPVLPAAETAKDVKSWMGKLGYSGGTYFVFFPYMAPDNNVFIASAVMAELFCDRDGIKNLISGVSALPKCLWPRTIPTYNDPYLEYHGYLL